MKTLTMDEENQIEELCREVQKQLNDLIPKIDSYIPIKDVRILEYTVVICEVIEQVGVDYSMKKKVG